MYVYDVEFKSHRHVTFTYFSTYVVTFSPFQLAMFFLMTTPYWSLLKTKCLNLTIHGAVTSCEWNHIGRYIEFHCIRVFFPDCNSYTYCGLQLKK